MANFYGAFGSLGVFGILILILLGIIMPISTYAAQKWAYRCYKELKEINTKLDKFK
jgi:hypothetical protein